MTKDTAKSPSSKAAEPPGEAHHSVKDSVRETIESIVIAFVLAFLFRTFEAEAFVIPTGSMATTLMGRHKDVECPTCRFPFRVGDSEESSQVTNWTCPNCNYETRFNRLSPHEPPPKIPPTHNGDRIIVTKFVYDFADPRRWDVSVFKFPALAKTNFIKRIVGLPHETVWIKGGNIHTGPEGATPADAGKFVLQRKPPDKVLAMLQMVYDNDYVVPWMIERGFPARWEAQPPGSWRTIDDGKSFATDGQSDGHADDAAWIRYQHVMPDRHQWTLLEEGPLLEVVRRTIVPQHIKDSSAYNTGPGSEGRNNVGDLAVECELTAESPDGEVVLQLIHADRRFRCTIDLSSGRATLSADGLADYHPQADTRVRGPGSYALRLANVDDQLLLWVDDALVTFDAPTEYDLPIERKLGNMDLYPAAIGSRGAKLRVDHLRVLRDVYYIAEKYRNGGGQEIVENPQGAIFSLGDGQFLALGDNSAKSRDSRLWNAEDEHGNTEYYVHRDMLIGKAMFIYWPHAIDHIPYTNIPFPLFPNIPRMEFIR